MRWHDRLYGTFEIVEPVLRDVLASQAMRRLRGVQQHGITSLIGVTQPITRFEHSVGTMWIVRHLGGTLAEQIAALIHDVSHTAFSHVMDNVFGSALEQGFHDTHKARYIAGSDLPICLAAHGYDWRQFLDDSAFTLLEQERPALCADRLDYFLRDSVGLGLARPDDIERVVAQLQVADGRIVCTDRTVAAWLGYTFMAADDASWSNFREVGLYELTAQALRRGFALGVLEPADIWSEDVAVWSKMTTAEDPELQRLVRLVQPETAFVWDEDRPDFTVAVKIRTIDPDILIADKRQPLSQTDPDFHQARLAYVARKEGSWPMRVVAAS